MKAFIESFYFQFKKDKVQKEICQVALLKKFSVFKVPDKKAKCKSNGRIMVKMNKPPSKKKKPNYCDTLMVVLSC